MPQKKNPGSAGTLRGTGKHTPAVSGAAYHKKQHADNESIWSACREALDADASRKAQANARLQAAALRLSFAKKEDGSWEKACPHCQRNVRLVATKQGGVRASGSDCGLTCPAIPNLQRWLCDEGFQS